MKKMLTLLTLALLPALALAQPPKVPQVPAERVGPPKVVTEGHVVAFKQAEKEGKHAIICVGIEPQSISGTVIVRSDDYASIPGVYVILWDGKRLAEYHHRFPEGTDMRYVTNWLAARSVVSLPASPFKVQSVQFAPLDGGPPIIADDDRPLPVGDDEAWPAKVEKPVGLTRYQRAKYTQTLDRLGSFSYANSRIQIVSRTKLEERWQVPGGMAGLKGWRNEFYKVLPREPKTYKGLVTVFNGKDNQFEQGWRQTFHNGSVFFDLLINAKTNKPFELRKAEKQDGEWRRNVVFRDVEQRPEGYAGLTVTCASCHSQALSGNYSGPLISGDDTVFSNKHPQLEE